MRIERVVANNFGEASEQARRRYGRDALVLSTNKVGNVTELLVCVESDETEPCEPESATLFRAALESQLVPKKSAAKVVATSEGIAAAQVAVAADDGASLVRVIRQELQALEQRLAGSTGAAPLWRERMALLEQGLSAARTEALLQHMPDYEAMAEHLVAELVAPVGDFASATPDALIVGPAGSGKTTLVMQMARDGIAVHSLRDTRPGSRERFFAMADEAGVEAGWGAGVAVDAIVDSGPLTLGELRSEAAQHPSRKMILALSAHLGRSEALRWLTADLPLAGVVVTHWDETRMPLAVLGAIVDSGQKLLALSDSAQPTATVRELAPSTISRGIQLILQLALTDSQRVAE